MRRKTKQALLLDRDGVINKLIKYGQRYDSPLKLRHVILIDGIIDLIHWASLKNIPVIVVTNQPNIAHGKITLERTNEINVYIKNLLKENKALINDFYVCPHHPEGKIAKYSLNCQCRKPKPGMLLQVARDYDIDLSKSFLVGDRDKDIEAGITVGCTTILYYHEENNPDAIANSLKSNFHHKVTSHKEIISILEKQLLP